MPIYNCETYVGAAIEAQLEQTYTDFELVITDNASTDRSEEICRAYAARDPRIKYHRTAENLGATANYRLCLEFSVGEYFRWNPCDDLVSPNLVERAVDILDRDDSIFLAYARTKIIDGEGNLITDFNENMHLMDDLPSVRWRGVLENLRLGNVHYGLSRARILRKTGLLRNFSGGDFPLIAEMSLYGKFYEISDAFFYRRMHERAASALKNNSDIMVFYDPKHCERFFSYNLFHLVVRLKSVVRAPIPLLEKLRIFGYEVHRTISGRKEFGREIVAALRETAKKFDRR